jgi:hypothetical protein
LGGGREEDRKEERKVEGGKGGRESGEREKGGKVWISLIHRSRDSKNAPRRLHSSPRLHRRTHARVKRRAPRLQKLLLDRLVLAFPCAADLVLRDGEGLETVGETPGTDFDGSGGGGAGEGVGKGLLNLDGLLKVGGG